LNYSYKEHKSNLCTSDKSCHVPN